MEAPCGIDEQKVDMPCFRRLHGIKNDRTGICSLLRRDHLDPCAVCPYLKLFRCRRAEGIRCRNENLFTLLLIAPGELAEAGSLADTVDADEHDNRRALLKVIGVFIHGHLIPDILNQQFPALGRAFDVLLLYLGAEIVEDLTGCLHPDVRHDKDLLEILVEVIINSGIGEDPVHVGV